jgi:predicted phage baseplate assembly protein
VNANVALATHGETLNRALGTGDGSRAFQRLPLPEGPLTHVSADTSEGTVSTLEVRVNQLLWQEVRWFHGHGPDERIYITRTDDQGKTTVVFGDGRNGARVPSGVQGSENVWATYRKGLGAEGLVAAGQLSLALTKPLGVRSVTNPLPAVDSAAPETSPNIRRNMTLPIRTLERIVSLQDYEDFCRDFAGIGKALATWTWNGRMREVFVTVAGEGGTAVARGGVTHANLLAAIREAGDAAVPVRLGSYRPAYFMLKGRLATDPAYRQSEVREAVEQALHARFSFEQREFGQPVIMSEVIAAIQGVRGVVALDLDELHRTDATGGLKDGLLLETLASDAPRSATGSSAVLAAELLVLDPRPIDLGFISE